MLKTRVIPCLLLKGQGLVKTIKFKDPKYVGDPINAVKIFNDKEVDELIFLDISATPEKRKPNFKLIQDIASEAFMPFGYGGGVRDIDDVKKLFNIGVEKVIVNSYAVENPSFIRKVADIVGSQSIVVSIDVKKSLLGKYEVFIHSGKINSKLDPVTFARLMQPMGAGELFINSIDRDGTMTGYDLHLIKKITEVVAIPVITCGGAGKVEDFVKVVTDAGASAVSAGSMFVFHGKHRSVLINVPTIAEMKELYS